jgi:hypothetical protein
MRLRKSDLVAFLCSYLVPSPESAIFPFALKVLLNQTSKILVMDRKAFAWKHEL